MQCKFCSAEITKLQAAEYDGCCDGVCEFKYSRWEIVPCKECAVKMISGKNSDANNGVCDRCRGAY
jgi:hypothetical protein